MDTTKDQSYALAAVRQGALARALFPLGGLAKTEVRRLADRERRRLLLKPPLLKSSTQAAPKAMSLMKPASVAATTPPEAAGS